MKVRRGHRISQKKASDFVIAMAVHGNHHYSHLQTKRDVERFFSERGTTLASIVDAVRDGGLVTHLENLAGPTSYTRIHGEMGIRSSAVRTDTGEEIAGFDGDGTITLSVYWDTFEKAEKCLHYAIADNSYVDLKMAVERGVASIEAYISYRVDEWNRANPTDLLIDNATNKISFADKIDVWVPKMSGGHKVDRGGIKAQHFFQLKTFRDVSVIHPKRSVEAVATTDLITLIDKFRTGIAGFLFDLHVIFSERVPASIIREMFSADALRDNGL